MLGCTYVDYKEIVLNEEKGFYRSESIRILDNQSWIAIECDCGFYLIF